MLLGGRLGVTARNIERRFKRNVQACSCMLLGGRLGVTERRFKRNVQACSCTGVHFSSKTVKWATPQDFFDKLDAEFHFTVDLCATPEAIVIQQDAIKELYEAVIGSKLQIAKDSDWSKIRDVRNQCAGHPANRAFGVPATQRAFMGRHFGHYNQIRYELLDARAPNQPSHPTFNLSAMIKAYDTEGAQTLNTVLCALATKWPKAVTPS